MAQFWPQWALNPQHTGEAAVAGQTPNRILASVVYDPLVPDEMSANGGDLLAHYQVPLIDGDRVFMEFKAGNYSKNPRCCRRMERPGAAVWVRRPASIRHRTRARVRGSWTIRLRRSRSRPTEAFSTGPTRATISRAVI